MRGGTAYRHYKTKRGAHKRCALLRNLWPEKEFGVVFDHFGWAVALFEDGRVRALCA